LSAKVRHVPPRLELAHLLEVHEHSWVTDADVILAFWCGTTCGTLVHELSHDQPNTTRELLDIATRHASGEEVVGDAFI
jgi:hypothetical protein